MAENKDNDGGESEQDLQLKIKAGTKTALEVKKAQTENRNNQLMTIFRKSILAAQENLLEENSQSRVFSILSEVYFMSSDFEETREQEFMNFLG